jgi:hypothetical protein
LYRWISLCFYCCPTDFGQLEDLIRGHADVTAVQFFTLDEAIYMTGNPRADRRHLDAVVSRPLLEFYSGLVDLVVGVGRYRRDGHRFAVARKRFIRRVAEDIAQMGDRGCDFGEY